MHQLEKGKCQTKEKTKKPTSDTTDQCVVLITNFKDHCNDVEDLKQR